jgi:hypothetical protein
VQTRFQALFGMMVMTAMTCLIIPSAPLRAQAQPERIEVKRGNSWYPATVLKREGTRVQVHYEGLSSDFDEWVGPDRIREAAVSPVKPAALSPGRKYLAISGNQSLAVFEALTGKMLAALPLEGHLSPQLVFRPDGKQIAAVYFGRVRVWDFETGKPVHDVILPPGSSRREVDWVADDYMLLNSQYLLDLPRRVILWEYTSAPGGRSGGAAHAGRYWYITAGLNPRVKTLASTILPDAAAKKVAAGLDPEKLLAVKPGASVSLEVNIDFPGDARERVVKALEAKLKANGVRIAEGQPIKLTATTAPGESRQMQYHRFGRMGAAETITVNEQKLRIAFEMDGQPLWENVSTVGAPMMLSLKKDQSIDQAIAESKANAWHFFERVDIPKHVPRLPEKLAYGTSMLTARGPQPPGQQQQQ